MKKKLMMIWMLLFGVQTTVQAKLWDDVKLYYAVACFVVKERIKSMNPFGKAIASFDYDDEDFSFEPNPVAVPKFKKYQTKNGKLILPTITQAMRKKLQKLKKS